MNLSETLRMAALTAEIDASRARRIRFCANSLIKALERENVGPLPCHPDHPDTCALRQLKWALEGTEHEVVEK